MGVPPPKGQRGLLVSAAAAACSKPDGGGGAEWHARTHMNVCERAQPVLRAHVLLCRMTSHSSALQAEETGPLVRGEQQKRGGKGGVKKRCCRAHRRDA